MEKGYRGRVPMFSMREFSPGRPTGTRTVLFFEFRRGGGRSTVTMVLLHRRVVLGAF